MDCAGLLRVVDRDDHDLRVVLAGQQAIGFGRGNKIDADQEAIERAFSPEFRNRLDAVIPFGALPSDVVRMVVDKFIMQLEMQLADRAVEIELDDEARDWLASKGYDAAYGARPLARVVQEHIKKPLAEMMLFGDLANGGIAYVSCKDEGLVVTAKPAQQKPKSKKAEKV